ncbi:DUF397 domain-containing protein [Streptomyces sp. LX-29]|uniref:DUF397 domain-containing protein n=1 Tax=Streptomyces sp. LX-29 TaxID=2900152 RepID=UPI00240D5CB9|nr:DUF397 domain-containing protein [Streptomyces sp. LX-29]WFB09106.1 DUF397 domain-containing protein [Streptomyces sp. LX-29]
MANTPDLSSTKWVKSSYSNGGGNCLEWAPEFAATGAVPVRDSKNPDGPALVFATPAWKAFVTAVAKGAPLA